MYISGSMSNKALGTQFHNQVIPQFVQLLNMKNKRRTAEMKIEIWRTLEATRRKGNV